MVRGAASLGSAAGGRELEAVIEALGAWGVRGAFRGPRLEELDGGLITPPGFDSALIVRADLRWFHRLWLGHLEYDTSLRRGSVVVDGLAVLAKQLRQVHVGSAGAFVREYEHARTPPVDPE
jgi:hypothetical protein